MGRPPSGSTETAPTPVLRTVPAARPPGIRSVRQRPANKLTTRFEQRAWPAEFKNGLRAQSGRPHWWPGLTKQSHRQSNACTRRSGRMHQPLSKTHPPPPKCLTSVIPHAMGRPCHPATGGTETLPRTPGCTEQLTGRTHRLQSKPSQSAQAHHQAHERTHDSLRAASPLSAARVRHPNSRTDS